MLGSASRRCHRCYLACDQHWTTCCCIRSTTICCVMLRAYDHCWMLKNKHFEMNVCMRWMYVCMYVRTYVCTCMDAHVCSCLWESVRLQAAWANMPWLSEVMQSLLRQLQPGIWTAAAAFGLRRWETEPCGESNTRIYNFLRCQFVQGHQSSTAF